MFWKRKKSSDFITLGLSDYTPSPLPAEEENTVEPVAPVEPVALVALVEPVALVTPTAPIAPITPIAEPEEDAGFFQRFRKAVAATRENIATKLEDVVKGKKEIDAFKVFATIRSIPYSMWFNPFKN